MALITGNKYLRFQFKQQLSIICIIALCQTAQSDHYYRLTTPHSQVSNKKPRCGRAVWYTEWRQPHLTGERRAMSGQFPWIAVVVDGLNLCTGALVHNRYVLTSGPCVLGSDSENLRVYVGRVTRPAYGDPSGLRVRQIILHRQNMIALLELERTLSFSNNLLRYDMACYKRRNPLANDWDEHCYVAGFGYDEYNSPRQTLYYSDYTNSKVRECNPGRHCELFNDSASRPCIHDRGSPLVCVINNTWTVMGVYNEPFNLESMTPCVKRKCCEIRDGDVYEAAEGYIGWLDSQIYGSSLSTRLI